MFNKLFALTSAAALGALAAATEARARIVSQVSYLNSGRVEKTRRYRYGKQYKKPLHLFEGGNADLPKSRQVERAEGRAEMKAMDRRINKRRRDDAGKALSQRSSERELREVSRKDSRFTVHGMLEASKGAGHLQRGAFK